MPKSNSSPNRWIVVAVAMAGALAAAVGYTCAQEKPAENPAEKPAVVAPTTAPVTPESPDLAPRYAALAEDTLRQPKLYPPHFREAAGLWMAAMRLDPGEPRYPRMLFEAMLKLGDNDGALAALKAYRSTTPEAAKDQLAMVHYLDLSARQLQTAQAQMDSYTNVLDSAAPDPVKSHAAFRASQLARDRALSDLEDKYLGRALELNPLNLDALRAKLETLNDDGTPLERVKVLLTMLKSNPVQPAVSYRLARELSEAGLAEESLQNYTRTVSFATALGMSMGREFAMGYATELYMMGQPQLLNVTETIIEQLLKQDVGDVEAILLRWLAERGGGKKEAADKTQQQVINAALNRVMVIRQKLGDATATTRPVDAPDVVAIPDITADVARLRKDEFQPLRVAYAQAATDLAWYLVYVANRPADAAKLLPALKEMLTDKSPTVVRIEGWIAYAGGKFDEAGVKFKAAADQDVMAQVGNLLLWAKNPAEKAPAVEAGKKLLQQNPSGLLGAILLDRLGELGIKAVEPGADSADLKKELAAFPKDWLRVIDAPQNFYQVHAEMEGGRVLYPFAEPMIARVRIKNISNYDITVGPEGVIRNDLWFDVQFRGLRQDLVVGAAYERLGQVLVLKPGQEIGQSLRLDQGQLAQVLARNTTQTLTFWGMVRTNPRGDGTAGPCGYPAPVTFSTITERAGFAINANSLRTLATSVTTGKTGERLRGLELMSSLIDQLKPQAADPQVGVLLTSFLEAMNRCASDTADPAVASWGSFLVAVQDPKRRAELTTKLSADPDPTRRVLGLMVGQDLPPDKKKELLAKAKADPDEILRTYATGMAELPQFEPAPTTQPIGPTPPPAAELPGARP